MNFIKCTNKDIENHKYGPHTNDHVNLEHVETFRKSRKNYYPDNEGIPIIVFNFVSKESVSWFYDKGEESIQEKDYKRIEKAIFKN